MKIKMAALLLLCLFLFGCGATVPSSGRPPSIDEIGRIAGDLQ